MTRPDTAGRAAVMARPKAVIVSAILGMAGVVFYVASWVVAGIVTPDYDPLRQAISEIFAIGAPSGPAALVRASLIVSGLALVAFGWALDHGLPGSGRAAPWVCATSGILTALIVVVPCTAGCPGVGSSTTDTLHAVVAGGGYLSLMIVPLLAARRVRHHAPTFARWSVILGGVALAGFLLRNLGVEVAPGLQQRAFNTIADAWYVVAGVYLIRRAWTASHGPLFSG